MRYHKLGDLAFPFIRMLAFQIPNIGFKIPRHLTYECEDADIPNTQLSFPYSFLQRTVQAHKHNRQKLFDNLIQKQLNKKTIRDDAKKYTDQGK